MKFIFLIIVIVPFARCQISHGNLDPFLFRFDLPEEDEEDTENKKEDEKQVKIFNDCNENTHRGNWICVKNEKNGKLSLTYDCSLNTEKNANIWIWSPKFPNNMNVLNIQNCGELTLYMGYAPGDYRNSHIRLQNSHTITFDRLNVINISNLEVFNYAPKKLIRHWAWEPNAYNDFSNRDPYHDFKTYDTSHFYYTSCTVHEIYFEKIKTARIETPIIPSDLHCFDVWDSILKFIDIEEFFIPNIHGLLNYGQHLKTLILRNVKINQVPYFNDDAAPPVFIPNIEITNSKFNSMGGTIINVVTTQIVISNNKFEKLLTSNYLQLDGDNITFSGNTFDSLIENSFTLKGRNIMFINNNFLYIAENAFKQISAPVFNPQDKTSRSYTFSNNIIHSLENDALTFSPNLIIEKMFFDNITITNNSINCICVNLYWFDSLFHKKNDVEQFYFYQKWSKENNLNKCFNIPNCSVKEILYNYQELCGEDFECLKDTKNNSKDDDFYFKKEEHVLSSLVNYNNEMNQNNSNLMQNLIEKIEIRNNKKFSKELEKESMKNDSVLLINERKEREKYLWKLSEINVIHSCLVVIVILFCLILCYVIVEKCLKNEGLKVLVLKFWPRPKPVIIQDVNSSSISELVSNT